MVKVGKCALIGLMHKKWTLRVELTKKTSHCKSRDFLRKRRLKTVFIFGQYLYKRRKNIFLELRFGFMSRDGTLKSRDRRLRTGIIAKAESNGSYWF